MTAESPATGTGPPGDTTLSLLSARFRLEEQVAAVADATVWRATDELLRRTVTIHVLAPQPQSTGWTHAILGAARIADPRLARIFDADYYSGRPYIVSECAPGETVEELLGTGFPDPCVAAAIVADAADALGIAHQAGVAHLCLGPRSLRWGASGVKITGLGIEAALCRAQASDPAAADTRALARMLYALLTGYWPGAEPTTLPPAPQCGGQWCAPRHVRAGVPGTLSAITRSALLEESSGPRISTPVQLARALHEATLVPAAPSRRHRMRRDHAESRANRVGATRQWWPLAKAG